MDASMASAAYLCAPYSVSYSTFSKRWTEGRNDGPQDGSYQPAEVGPVLPARAAEGQHYRIAGLNLLAAIVIYWNTVKLSEAVLAREKAGIDTPAEFLAHVSPLGWEHINLTGEYRWPGSAPQGRRKRLT